MYPSSRLFLAVLFLSASANAQYYGNGGYYGRRLAGGAIAGIVIGVLALILLCVSCSMFVRRRRRAYGPGVMGTGLGGAGQWGMFGGGRRSDAEAGFGGTQQPGWNTSGTPAAGYQQPMGAPSAGAPANMHDGAYQPPPGSPPVDAPPQYSSKPSGFAPPPNPPPEAHTRY